ncbi:right-handed parallel beta-helix repeat-containing protein [Paenibacillus filicis]|uniref:Right-handed parallel beta-helix repeat-containing protein n=2 Tax=Paenibacillus filicis TaxID=669464 RepID=A0ABU9DN51_9BACL
MESTPAPAVIRVTDYGAVPGSGQDAGPAVQRAILAVQAASGPVVLEFPTGRYDFYPEQASKFPYYISNTASEVENPDVKKTIGLWLQDVRGLTVDGQGSRFVFHGKMTMIVLDGCEDVILRNFSTDFERPTMSEFTVEAVGGDYLDVCVHPDSWYSLDNGKLNWVGEGWSYTDGPAQQYDPETNTTWRVDNPVTEASRVEPLAGTTGGSDRLRLYYDRVPDTQIGRVYQMRDGIRDQVGVFINRSRNVVMTGLRVHYMHGLGIVGQLSEDVLLDGLRLAPCEESGRTCAAFADFVHMSGCRGKITVTNSYFEGAHDDVINVHGTYLRIVGQPGHRQLLVRYMHHQTYGFQSFYPGDRIEFVRGISLIGYGSGTVMASEFRSPRELLLTLQDDVPDGIRADDVVENVTWIAEVEVRGNRFLRIPTRGVLATTRKKVLIENNDFEGMRMSGVLIAGDAESWYESGRVEDVTISGNRFIRCGAPVIRIEPENTVVSADQPVHRQIRVESNRFVLSELPVLAAKSTRDLQFVRNEVELPVQAAQQGKQLEQQDSVIQLEACTQVTIEDNSWTEGAAMKRIKLERMPSEEVAVAEGEGLQLPGN